ncbi:uncharacterized protein LOC124911500 [Impatiens glandulifera]|uniref:uncharacterized protein LOC124911500 n=1 Tax=Impatiens glandulifera TaxID=253017 RepID=UPI001FB16C32|nr:uncharacterized protein LOC124911500 [Impatiens glandulifera]
MSTVMFQLEYRQSAPHRMDERRVFNTIYRRERKSEKSRIRERMESKNSKNKERWGMEFLLVFFPDYDEQQQPISMNPKTQTSNLSSSPATSPAPPRLRRPNSSNLLNKAQSTIYICALLVFLSLLLFTLSTFDPPSHTSSGAAGAGSSRRRLYSSNLQIPSKSTSFRVFPFSLWKPNPKLNTKSNNSLHALQGMGKLYRRGTRAMTDLLVAHITESVTLQDLRLFLRTLHRSGLTSKADIVLLFPSSISSLERVVMEENESFSKLVTRPKSNSSSGLDRTQFMKSVKKGKEWGETIWGKRRIRSNYSGEGENESTRLSYGSVVSFTADELDPENSLAGFLDHVPMNLRRWATYPMLLGRLRRKFKHTALIDVMEILSIGDSINRVRTQSPESVIIFTESETTSSNKHGRKNSAKTQPKFIPGLIVGGERGVRRLSAAMLTEIVRVTGGSRKKKNSVTETGVFDQFVRNEHLMKSTDVVSQTESIAAASSLGSNSALPLIRGNKNSEMTSALLKQICEQESDPTVYSEC